MYISPQQKPRIQALEKVNYLCEKCQKPTNIIHHIDRDRTNSNVENLLCVCSKCHGKQHRGDKRKKPGPKTNISKTYQSITILYPLKLIDTVDEIARSRNITRTALMKEVITEYLEKINTDK